MLFTFVGLDLKSTGGIQTYCKQIIDRFKQEKIYKIKEIELSISESHNSLGDGEAIEELNTRLEEFQRQLTEIKNLNNEDSQYIEQLNNQVENPCDTFATLPALPRADWLQPYYRR